MSEREHVHSLPLAQERGRRVKIIRRLMGLTFNKLVHSLF